MKKLLKSVLAYVLCMSLLCSVMVFAGADSIRTGYGFVHRSHGADHIAPVGKEQSNLVSKRRKKNRR